MAQLANLARMFTETVGQSSPLTVSTVVPGFGAFADLLTDGLTYSYGIEDDYQEFDGVPIPQSREVGRGVWNAGAGTLTRTEVWSTDGAGAKLFLTGYAEVYITPLQDDFITLGGGTYQIKTTSGGITVAVRDSLILVNKTVGEATPITLPAASTKVGPVWVKDLKGDAETNNITVSVASSGTIDSAASYVMNRNKSARRFDPMPDGTNGYFILV